ncbi:alpha/beta fold hydrolase [Tistrella bauzanensis]
MNKTLLTSDGARISYVDDGAGEVLILLHGWSQSAAMFRHQIAEFSRTRRVIAPDFRGMARRRMRRMVIASIASPPISPN